MIRFDLKHVNLLEFSNYFLVFDFVEVQINQLENKKIQLLSISLTPKFALITKEWYNTFSMTRKLKMSTATLLQWTIETIRL